MLTSKTYTKLGFSLIQTLFWLALIGFIIVGYILKNYKEWEKKNTTETSGQLLKSNNLLDRTQGDQKLKHDLINNTP
jgi:hypothetical protein